MGITLVCPCGFLNLTLEDPHSHCHVSPLILMVLLRGPGTLILLIFTSAKVYHLLIPGCESKFPIPSTSPCVASVGVLRIADARRPSGQNVLRIRNRSSGSPIRPMYAHLRRFINRTGETRTHDNRIKSAVPYHLATVPRLIYLSASVPRQSTRSTCRGSMRILRSCARELAGMIQAQS